MKKVLFLFTLGFLLTSCGQTEPVVNPSEETYYEVTFDSNGGTSIESQRVLEGNPVRRPSNPRYDGHNFLGWFDGIEESSDQWDFNIDRVYSDLTLFAHWEVINEENYTESLVYEANDQGGYTVVETGQESIIRIPNTYNGMPVNIIGESAFAREQIEEIYIPDSIVTIERNAFYNCDTLVNVHINETSNLTTIDNNALSGCGALESFYLPVNFENLGDSVFNNCGGLNSFLVDEDNEFFMSTGNNLIERESMTLIRGTNNSQIPSGVVTIASAAFRRSTITTINIPSTVATIENYAFDYCYEHESFVVDENNENFYSANGILVNKSDDSIEIVPQGISGNVIVEEGIITIPRTAFYQRGENITGITLPSTIRNIGSAAFRGLNLTYLTFNGTVSEWENIVDAGGIDSRFLGYTTSEITITEIRCSDGVVAIN